MNFLKKTGLNVFSSFEPTQASARLNNTFNEVQTFKRQLLKSEAALHTYAKATEELLKTTDDSMAAFPRVWRKDGEEPNSAALPEADATRAAPTAKKLGAYPSQAFVTAMDAALHEEVFNPIGRWHKQYQTIKTRMASVEHAKNDMDAARREVSAARETQLKHVRKTDGKEVHSLDAAESQTKIVLARKREAYIAIEEEVYGELIALAADAQSNLGFVRRALRIQADALAAAEQQLATQEPEMPAIDRSTGGPLVLGLDGATPAGTPTGAGKSPTGYGNTFQYWDPNVQPGSPASAEKGAAASAPANPSPLGQTMQERRSAIEAVVRPHDAEPLSSGVAQLRVAEGAPQGGRAPSRLQDSASEIPSVPTHAVKPPPSGTAAVVHPPQPAL